MLRYTHASTHACLLDKHLQDIPLKARIVLYKWQARRKIYGAFPHCTLSCLCMRQVYLMRYYEDFFSALGLVRSFTAWPRGRACTRISRMGAVLYAAEQRSIPRSLQIASTARM